MNGRTFSFLSLTPGLILALVIGLTPTRLPAEEYTLDQWTFGEIVAGDDLDLDKLEGRVVAIEFWGPR